MKLTHIQFLLRFMCCFGGLGIICMVVACLSTNSATSTIDLYMLLEKTHTTAYFILLYFRTGISPHKAPSKPVSTLSRAMI